jgi:TPR repeat protein
VEPISVVLVLMFMTIAFIAVRMLNKERDGKLRYERDTDAIKRASLSHEELLRRGREAIAQDRTQDAVNYLSVAANAGHLESLLEIGKLTYKINHETAGHWFLMASLQHSPIAHYYLGKIAQRERNEELMVDHFTQAAALGHVPAMVELAERARDSGNLREAQRWYHSAYESGDSDSYFQLGRVLAQSGQQDQAREIFTDLSQQGDKRAAYELYALAERDGDDTAARAWLALGAKDGDNDCRFILAGKYLDQGQENEAEQLFSAAADSGHLPSMAALGRFLWESNRRDQGLIWLETSAQRGSSEGMWNYHLALETLGRLEEAEEWLSDAARAGNKQALEKIGSNTEALGIQSDDAPGRRDCKNCDGARTPQAAFCHLCGNRV